MRTATQDVAYHTGIHLDAIRRVALGPYDNTRRKPDEQHAEKQTLNTMMLIAATKIVRE
jgi:hypothetical protein